MGSAYPLFDRKLTILLVEDNPGDAVIFKRALIKQLSKIEVVVAKTGEEALEILRRGDLVVDVIFLDLNLPQMNGLDVLRELKADARSRIIPVMVLSSSEAAKDVGTAYERFATGYIVKPTDLDGYDRIAAFVDHCWFQMVTLPPHAVPSRPV